MHTLVVSMSTDPVRSADVAHHLQNDVAVWAKQQPGFISGDWSLSDKLDTGVGIVIFESAAAAIQAAAGPRRFMRDDHRAWNITDVTVYESVASATR
jgi:hypothetical protein